MTVSQHPAYAEELVHLDQTLRHISDEIAKHVPNIGYGGHRYAQRELVKLNAERLDSLKEAQQQPYFVRIDLLEHGKPDTETLYFGVCPLMELDVYSWASPMAETLYYQKQTRCDEGTVLLRRALQIEQGRLRSITDEHIDPRLAQQLGRAADQFTDSLLLQLLRENRRGKLYQIVATIQEQQYRIIKSPRDQLLVVQGVAGSGKSSIALHRVAYLLYNNRDVAARNTLILGPNQMFLGYIANILPSLGERRIPQRTFDAWLIEQLGDRVTYEPQDASLETMLDPAVPASAKAMQYRNAQTKGSLKMATLLDRYIATLEEDIFVGKDDLICTVGLPRNRNRTAQARRTISQLRAELDRVKNRPFNARREEVERRIVRDVSEEIQVRFATERQAGLIKDTEIQKQVEEHVRSFFESWRAQNVSIAYRRLLRNPELLQRAGAGIFSEWDLELLAQDAPTAQTPFRFSDLAALLYLKIRLDGTAGKLYDHIVIDEAQDITPLHFRVLYEYTRNSSMTVLGDLAQGIYSHHGVHGWSELSDAVGGRPVTIEQLQQSYRSTEQITEYANSLLRRISAPEDRLAVPIARPGTPPDIRQFTTPAELAEGIAELVWQERDAGHTSIAIVCKTIARCRDLDALLRAEGLDDHQIIASRDDAYAGQVVLMPSYLTKGLEFDAVIVADADAETYAPDELNARLLFVVLTRASHALAICSTGPLTPLLEPRVPPQSLQAPLGGALAAQLLTVAGFAERESLDPDWCIERLAATGKLPLLRSGTIDAVVLDVLLRGQATGARVAGVEETAQALNDAGRHRLAEQVAELEQSGDATVNNALAVTQLAYGLLRHQIRAAGLDVPDTADDDLAGQVVLLAPLLQALREGLLTPSAGRWTTRQRVLESVGRARRDAAERFLAALAGYGYIEESGSGARRQIRLSPQWIRGILEVALGYDPADWDSDLRTQLPRIPKPLSWESPVETRGDA